MIKREKHVPKLFQEFLLKFFSTAEHRLDNISVYSNYERIVDDRDAFHMSITHEQEADGPHRTREKPV